MWNAVQGCESLPPALPVPLKIEKWQKWNLDGFWDFFGFFSVCPPWNTFCGVCSFLIYLTLRPCVGAAAKNWVFVDFSLKHAVSDSPYLPPDFIIFSFQRNPILTILSRFWRFYHDSILFSTFGGMFQFNRFGSSFSGLRRAAATVLSVYPSHIG